ncbi:EAL domain-containing protein [Maritimibacter fusiformis]|uniref:EAL domain-containing protein n=1 Tax=Maritimibacter fusiformis TaxID=2603819 RepID=A0A5D0RGC1_9RHOB|nr:EAL domain-containing protein [Maritimibacter fusiformis]TYB79986.1 EAL domain-containing protein [Maritimibacter fusiformis]
MTESALPEFDDPALDPSSPLSVAIEQRDRDTIAMVRDAVDTGRITLAYQPIMRATDTDAPAFYEGLIRVLDPTGRVIPAADFFGTVENQELGRRLDTIALETGLKALARVPSLRLAINMSARSIGYPRWIATLRAGLDSDPTIGERLILEITERTAIVMPDLVQVFMAEMQRHGVAFALDNFGAGYTAFRYLKEFYFDILKIDGQFIQGIATNPDNQVITAAMLSLARHFDMLAVAEAVESAADAEYLIELGCDLLQGYCFAAPTTRPWWHETAQNRSA